MLKSQLLAPKLGSERLANIWTARYTRSTVSANPTALENTVSAKGRRKTVERLNHRFIKHCCRRGAIRTSDLYVCYKESTLGEISALAKFATQVYDVLLKFYQSHTPILDTPCKDNNPNGSAPQAAFQIPDIISLVNELEPLLSEFHTQQTIEKHWQTRSFLSTQLSFSSWFLLDALTKEEQLLLGAYCYCLEEYVSMPWHGIYKAANNHGAHSTTLNLAERMLPQIATISVQVYTQWSSRFSGYYSRRGQLNNAGVKHSSLRDFSMFQVYLWLCILQGNLDAIEQELVVLCSRVYRGIGIPWEMTIKGTQLLAEEVSSRLTSEEQALVSPYTEGMLDIFRLYK